MGKQAELRQLYAFLRCLGEDPRTWSVLEERERPDFTVRAPSGRVLGIELTEMLCPADGRVRSSDRALCRALEAEVHEALRIHGGTGGGCLCGNNKAIEPLSSAEIQKIRKDFKEHLRVHGAPLKADNGTMKVPFAHRCGAVEYVSRLDSSPQVFSSLDDTWNQPDYRHPPTQAEIEAGIMPALSKKIAQASSYSYPDPVWLGIRSSADRFLGLSETAKKVVQGWNVAAFERVFIFNDLEGVLDPRPPKPHFVVIHPLG